MNIYDSMVELNGGIFSLLLIILEGGITLYIKK